MPGRVLWPYLLVVIALALALGGLAFDDHAQRNQTPTLTPADQSVIDKGMIGTTMQDGSILNNPKVRAVEPAHAVRVSVDVKPPKDKDGNQPDSQAQDLIVVFDKADRRLLTIPAPQD